MQSLASDTVDRMRAALDDDLNTAQAQAALFDMVRLANAAFDASEVKKDDVPPLLVALYKFDEVFAVLDDDDVPKMKKSSSGLWRKVAKKTSATKFAPPFNPANFPMRR